jgi:hypothetical protein
MKRIFVKFLPLFMVMTACESPAPSKVKASPAPVGTASIRFLTTNQDELTAGLGPDANNVWKCEGLDTLIDNQSNAKIKLTYIEINQEKMRVVIGVSNTGEGSGVSYTEHKIQTFNAGLTVTDPIDLITVDGAVSVTKLMTHTLAEPLPVDSKLLNRLGSPIEIKLGGITFSGEIGCTVFHRAWF